MFSAVGTGRIITEEMIELEALEWDAWFVFARKKDGSLFFCVDYRKLNAFTIRGSYPIPCMDGCINVLKEATVLSTMSASSGYWEIVDEHNCGNTTLTSDDGPYRYNSKPVGLKKLPQPSREQ